MTEASSAGVIERLFDRMTAGDWTGCGALLSPDVERIGPMGERMVGRDRYIEMMAGPRRDANGTTWDVHQIAYSPDRLTGFARVTAHLGAAVQAPFERFEEILAFMMDDNMGLVCRVEVFWQTPWLTPPANT